jgi:hypothetical protein
MKRSFDVLEWWSDKLRISSLGLCLLTVVQVSDNKFWSYLPGIRIFVSDLDFPPLSVLARFCQQWPIGARPRPDGCCRLFIPL